MSSHTDSPNGVLWSECQVLEAKIATPRLKSSSASVVTSNPPQSRRQRWSWAKWFVVVAFASACKPSTPPTLTAVMPQIGYPRQLLAVDGTTLHASVVWDVGRPTETILDNGLFGTSYFQIPVNATPEDHPVAIRNARGTSATKYVTVLEPPPCAFPPPRIEDVGILGLQGNGPVDIALTVAGANVDVDGTVSATQLVAGVPVQRPVNTTVRWGALPLDYLQHHKPCTFGYPIYHYTQLLSVVHGVALDSSLTVTVTNKDLQKSTREYPLPKSTATLDSDGDGLQDSWEDGSYPAPESAHTVPLAAMGTNKWRKNILVEVDWVQDGKPDDSVWQTSEEIFKDAPVLNPDGSRGIDIIIDHGQGGALSSGGEILTEHDCLTYGEPTTPGPAGCNNVRGFFSYKATNFNPDRLRIFHYAIFGRNAANGSTGEGERHGNDFFVTLLGTPVPNIGVFQMGHFVHELGHNLGFSHGDLTSDDQNYNQKPNLPSVMNYRYVDAGVDVGCDMKSDGVYSYSQGTLASIDEATVDEKLGICDGAPVDMDEDNAIAVGADINHDGDKNDQSDDFDQWGHLLLKFDVDSSKWNKN